MRAATSGNFMAIEIWNFRAIKGNTFVHRGEDKLCDLLRVRVKMKMAKRYFLNAYGSTKKMGSCCSRC